MTMEMFVWWEVPLSMRAEWRCVLMTNGELCVTTPGTELMLRWSVTCLDMLTLEVSWNDDELFSKCNTIQKYIIHTITVSGVTHA